MPALTHFSWLACTVRRRHVPKPAALLTSQNMPYGADAKIEGGGVLLQKLQSLRQSSDQDRSKLEKRFKERLKEMDVKMRELHRKEKQFCQLERLKARSEETCARLNGDILAIKQQKVCYACIVSTSALLH